MNINDISQEGLAELYELVKDYADSIELWGSSCCDFIKSPGDIDIHVCTKNKHNYYKLKQLFKDNSSDTTKKSKQYFKSNWKLCLMEIYLKDPVEQAKYSTIHGYQIYFRKPLFNYQLSTYYGDFLASENLYKESLQKTCTWIATKNSFSCWPTYKLFYQIYLAMCFYKNKSYILTADQINNVNLILDSYHKYRQEHILENGLIILGLILECFCWLEVDKSLYQPAQDYYNKNLTHR